MLTQEEHLEVHALRKRGWSYSAIARHLDISRNTVKAYLRDGRQPGERRRPIEDPFERYQEYVAERLREDPHVWGTALYDEARRLGYDQSYITFARQVRQRDLRPRCEACVSRRGHAPTIEIRHEPGEEILWGTPHRISYAALGNMRRRRPLAPAHQGPAPHNHRLSRKARRRSVGR